MNSYSELPFQYEQDVWSLLLARAAQGLRAGCGREAEAVVRTAARTMGFKRGEAARERAAAQGIKADLETLHSGCAWCSMDPRCRRRILRSKPDVVLYEVDTCPLAGLWAMLDASDVGTWYCEEFTHGQMAGYTAGAGQVNLATRLTYTGRTENIAFMDDNCCRFSEYYRAANAVPALRDAAFGEGLSAATPADAAAQQDDLRHRCVELLNELYAAAEEQLGTPGICALAGALRAAAPELAGIYRKHAADLLMEPDRAFLRLHFPLALETAEEPLWAAAAAEFVQINLLDPFKAALGVD